MSFSLIQQWLFSLIAVLTIVWPKFWFVKVHSEQSRKSKSFYKMKMNQKRKIWHFSQERVLQTNTLIALMLLLEEMFILIQIVDEESSKLIVHNFTQIFTFHWKLFYQHFSIYCREGHNFLSVKLWFTTAPAFIGSSRWFLLFMIFHVSMLLIFSFSTHIR